MDDVENAEAALSLLVTSQVQGYWIPKASRKVRAALSKANVAKKRARQAREFYEAAFYEHAKDVPSCKSAWHGVSRFARGTKDNWQCHACGHAIKDAGNWVPLVVDGPDGAPRSFWVGRDCASKLLEVEVTGEGRYANRE